MGIYIFISYGHDAHAERVQVIYDQLKKGNDNFEIWWDRKLRLADNWVSEIDRHLNNLIHHKPNSCFVYVVTPHSANTDRDNFCIKEIAKAVEGRVRVIPVKLVETPMPLLLSNIQWLDLSDTSIDAGNQEFLRRIDSLTKIIMAQEELPRDGKQEVLSNRLEPCHFSLDLEKHLTDYEPRMWLLDVMKQWIEHSESQLLLLTGGPGTGKTAFSIWMSYSELSQYVAAWHLCQYNDMRTCSLRTAVKSIAYYLATRIPEYYNLLDVIEIDKILTSNDLDAGTLFKVLILEKVRQINHDGTLVVLIDALDEASRDNHNELAEMLSRYVGQLPKWLKIVVTSRNDVTITTHLADCATIINLDDASLVQHGADDIHRYVSRVMGADVSMSEFVTSESGNNFLYARLLCNSIKEDQHFDPGALPNGINSYYSNYLKRYFNNRKFDFDEHAVPLLNLLLATYEPLDKNDVFNRLHETCEWCTSYSVFNNLVKCFGPLLKQSHDCLLPFHKSLSDWLLDNGKNQEFPVYKADGTRELIKWGLEIIEDEFPDPDDRMVNHFYRYLPQYMIEACDKAFVRNYTRLSFWQQRQSVLGVNKTLSLLIDELALCKPNIRKQLFANDAFFNVLNYFNIDLFNTGRYTNLYQLGYVIPVTTGMDDSRRLFAIRYLYINELYGEIDDNVDIFEEPYQDHVVEAMLMNELGQTYRKLGQLSRSAAFYTRSLDNARAYKGTLDEIIYTILNLSRIYMLQCRQDEARSLLEEATELFNTDAWHNSMQGADFEFSAQQLERAVHFVTLETEIFSLQPDDAVCRKALQWADDVYGDVSRRDRYYPNHLISRIFYQLRMGYMDGVENLIRECERSIVSKYDGIRLWFVKALFNLANGQVDEAYKIATEYVEYLKTLQVHKIQLSEFVALSDYLSHQDNSLLLSDEFHPWYKHVSHMITDVLNHTINDK